MNKILWKPEKSFIESSEMMKFIHFVNEKENTSFNSYDHIYNWSIEHADKFWSHFSDFSEIIFHKPHTEIVDDINKMPGATWFKNSELNFAENLLKRRDTKNAIITIDENNNPKFISYKDLFEQVSKLAHFLKTLGVEKNDRVVAFMPNIAETVIAMLATSSIGAIWSSCSPDFGVDGVLDRFKQIKPKILFFANGYQYNGKRINCKDKVTSIINKLPSIDKTIMVDYYGEKSVSLDNKDLYWNDIMANTETKEINFEPLPFDHPLYIMYSSGTTGKPKSIVHSAGGTLIQHLKELRLHTNITNKDTVFYFTTCGWMMWNWLVSSLSLGATIVLYDGNPCYPKPESLLEIADNLDFTVFGTSAKYISILNSSGVKPKSISSFNKLNSILSTGSTLSSENFDYIYSNFKNIQLSSISGGTDIISCFALGNPILPVYRGELQCKGLGMNIDSYNFKGESIKNSKGELVCKTAFPSMPIYFWNDDDGLKYHSAYFDNFKDTWSHGDYIEINDHGGVIIYGRSDATLNPGGVRIGTAEIYNVLEKRDDIDDSLVIGKTIDNDEKVILFVKMSKNYNLTEDNINSIKLDLRSNCSPRHIPYKILEIDEIPYTINGKKVEIAVKNILNNLPLKNTDSISNPKSLEYFYNIKINT